MRIFISYSRTDSLFLSELVPMLREVYGHDSVWYDGNLTGGDEWWAVILREVKQCSLFLYLLSDQSTHSKFCRAELAEAFRLRKRIIPVVCSRTRIPHELNRIQTVDMAEGVRLSSFARLLGAIHRAGHDHQDTLTVPLSETPTPLPDDIHDVELIVDDYKKQVEFEVDSVLSTMVDSVSEQVIRNLPKVTRIRVKQSLRSGQSGSQVLLVDVDPLPQEAEPVGPHYLKVHSDSEKTSNLLASIDALQNTPIRSAMPTIADYVVHQDRLAVLYKPAQGGRLSAREVISLGDLLNVDLSSAMEHISGLSVLLKEWNSRPQKETHQPYQVLVDLLGRRRIHGDESVQSRVKRLLAISDEPLRLIFAGELLLPNPMAFLSHQELWGGATSQAIVIPIGHVHGDLHANNLICQRRKPSAQLRDDPFPDILDFATYNPNKLIYFDMAYLEFDLIIRLNSFESREYRKEIIRILPQIMNDDDLTLRTPIPGGFLTRTIPDLIRPLREAVESHFGHRADDYRVAFWLAAVAVGLNFARKRTSSVSAYDNLFGVMYSACALKNVLTHFGVPFEFEQVPSINWLER
ncbi:MAG: toll/interleukin-1 receptor domain-containing protein [Anaerolineae bacterium]|nr:toll/interleukin-1 receptor domain-containing protein [Anaerolineae bacterium]